MLAIALKRTGLSLVLALACLRAHAQVSLTVHLDSALIGPYSGRLFVHTLKDTAAQFNDRNMAEEPAYFRTVTNWKAGEPVSFAEGSTPSHSPLNELAPGVYKLVAILDTNTRERAVQAPGNLYSRQEGLLYIDAPGKGRGSVTLSSVFRERALRETETLKEVKLRSALLSDFRKEDIFMKAAVVLPASYATSPQCRYPVVCIIPGWGGTHFNAANPNVQQMFGMGQGKDKIYVYLNPETQTPWGLHAFVDSRVNGPWGKALVTELLPYLRQHFRIKNDPTQTFIAGQSSGGYGAVWLALHYPGSFGGCWATAPDPLDFSSFTGVNLYEDANYYTNASGEERGFLRMNGAFRQTQRQASQAELFTGDGGQQQSFEAEFGLPGPGGRPKPLYDVQTGRIDKSVVAEWKPYDLALYVQQNWPAIRKAGVGKITVYAGTEDNFLLNESVAAFARKAAAAGADIRTVLVPGADHFNLRNAAWAQNLQAEIDALIVD